LEVCLFYRSAHSFWEEMKQKCGHSIQDGESIKLPQNNTLWRMEIFKDKILKDPVIKIHAPKR
jgi:hypothetical protein